MINAFIAGWPISHSLSPVLHGYWLRLHGIAGSYQAIAVPPEEFATFFCGLAQAGLKGGNITIPHKEAAFALCDELDEEASTIGAVNTVVVEDGRLLGRCTDGFGFAANLDDGAPHWRQCRTALLLGAGGAARAIIHSMIQAGISSIQIANRSLERAEKLADEFGPATSAISLAQAALEVESCELVVNTTSLGMGRDTRTPLSLERAAPGTIVSDAVYVPLETPLLAEARVRGLTVVDGLGMLLHQAIPGFELWFGVRPQVDLRLRQHVLAELAARDAAR